MRRFWPSVLLAVVAITGCSQLVGELSPQDFQSITNLIRSDTGQLILDIRAVRDSVIVDTGHERAVDQSYELTRSRKGWKNPWEGT